MVTVFGMGSFVGTFMVLSCTAPAYLYPPTCCARTRGTGSPRGNQALRPRNCVLGGGLTRPVSEKQKTKNKNKKQKTKNKKQKQKNKKQKNEN